MNPIDALMRQCQQQEAEIRRLKAQLELQPCGHPNACIVIGEEWAPGEYNHYCGWCQSLDMARWQERARCIEIARSHADDWHGLRIASIIAEQDIREDS